MRRPWVVRMDCVSSGSRGIHAEHKHDSMELFSVYVFMICWTFHQTKQSNAMFLLCSGMILVCLKCCNIIHVSAMCSFLFANVNI